MNKKILTIVMLFFSTLFLFAETGFGAAGAKESAPSWTVEQMLKYAIEDEYFARAEYVAIMEHFNVSRPFATIKKAEDTHISLLEDLYRARNIAIPTDTANAYVMLPQNLEEAYRAGEQAEIANIEMYSKFLESPLLKARENADILSVFTRLKNASESHLAAFRKQLSR